MKSKSTPANAADNSKESTINRIQAGLIAGLLAVVYSISHASLVTGGVAPEATATVIGMALIGTAVLCFTVGQFSQIKGLIPIVQDVPSAAIGAILAAIVADRAVSGSAVTPEQIITLCLLAGLTLAVSLLVFGSLRLAGVIRFAPRPVMAGFLAGTGYFVIIGALAICLGTSVTLSSLSGLMTATVIAKIIVALTVTGAMYFGDQFLSPKYAIGLVIGGAILVFHIGVAVLGIDFADLASAGWFAQVPAEGLPWRPLNIRELFAFDFQFVINQIVPLGTMVVLATAALLMNQSALEAKTRTDIDHDLELRKLGLANFAAAALGGLPGYHGVSTTLASLRIANGHRFTSFCAGLFVLVVFFFGNTLLLVLPLPIFAGFILWVGIGLVHEWLYREMRMTPPGEAWLTAAIFLVIVTVGLIEGTIFGLIAGAILFIVNYSRLDPIQGELFGDVIHGSDEMTPEQLKVLDAHGGAIAIIKLQGYVFFGTAYGLNKRIKHLMDEQPVRFLILDLEHVTGVDATAVASIGRILGDLETNGLHTSLVGMSAEVTKTLMRGDVQLDGNASIALADDLNSGLSTYETIILSEFMPEGYKAPETIDELLEEFLQNKDTAQRLQSYLELVTASPGDLVITSGETHRDMYFLETGRVEILIGSADATKRVRTMGPGAIIGEISFYGEGTRTSSVRALDDTRLWRFTADIAAQVLSEDPELSSHFHAAIASVLAERVKANTRLIQTLST